MTTAKRISLALACLAALAACGTERSALSDMTASILPAFGSGRDGPSRVQTPPEVIRAQTQPIIFVRREATGDEALANRAAINGANVTWMTADQRSLTLRGGMLVATRGFPGDLMSAEVPALPAGEGQSVREHSYLGGDELIERIRFECRSFEGGTETIQVVDRAYTARLVRERCAAPGYEFENRYWYDAAGDLRQIRQWAGPDIGDLTIQAVVD